MRLFCKHCHSNIDTDIHLIPGLDIKQAMTQPVSGLWYAKCPCCGHLIDFTPPAGDIVVCFADDTKRPASFKDNFDGQDIMRYHVFQTLSEFLLWWIPQTEHWEGMWYYVFDKGVQICSGAVDPYDIDIWREHFGTEVVNRALNDCIKAGVRFNDPDATQTSSPDAPVSDSNPTPLNKTTYKQVSNYLANELGLNRTTVLKIIDQKIENRNIPALVEQCVARYFHKGPNGWRAGDIIESRIRQRVDEEIQKCMTAEVKAQMQTIVDSQVAIIMANITGKQEGSDAT